MIAFGLLLYLTHFLERDPSDPYSRPIVSDAKGYYAYLPAIFIYQDLEYEFIPEMDEKYYAVGHEKHIFIEVDGYRVNKTFPGVAILYLPFFLIAHFLALLLGLEADGYSLIYQYLFDFGQFFYATLGLVLAGKFLESFIKNRNHILLAVLAIALGSNLWFYTLYDQSVTHVYNFFLVNLMLFWLIRFQNKEKDKHLIGSMLVFSLILITRPTGILSIFILFFFFSKKSFYVSVLNSIKKIRVLVAIVAIVGLVFCIPLVLWKLQSGSWIVYSYGEEGFDFSKPQIMDFLFSYGNGWFLYSPIILFSLIIGGITLIKAKEIHKISVLVTFVGLAVYVFSSWWCWYYGFSFGQRVMVDFYLLVIYLLAYGFSKMNNVQLLLSSPLIGFMVFLNIHQSHQHYHGYYSTPTPTKEMYWDNFLNFQKQARVYLDESQEKEVFSFDFEEDLVVYSGEIIAHDESRGGKRMTYVDEAHQFSGNIDMSNELLLDNPVVISAHINAKSNISETCLVVEHRDVEGTYVAYYLQEYVVQNQWVKVEFLYENQWIESSNDIHVYFWNQESSERMYIDDMQIVILH